MRYYDVLFRYSKENNWNDDGSPSNEDTYYMIGKVKSDDGKLVLKAVQEEDLSYLEENCNELKELFASDDYAEDTLEIVQMLSESCAGHLDLETPWYTENWWKSDIENALREIGIPLTEVNVNKLETSCKHIFDDKSTRNEMLVDCARVTFMYKILWKELSDIPMDPETECIESEWNNFPAGTHREEIWHWFEETFNLSVAKDLMGL